MSEVDSSAAPHYAAGVEKFRKGDLQEAVTHFCRAADADKKFHRAFAYLGMTYAQMEKLDEAIEAYRKCIDLAPEYHKAYNNVGEVYRRKGLLDYASVVFKMATEIETDHAPYLYNLGLTYSDLGMTDLADQALSRAVELDPKNFESVAELAQVRFSTQNSQGALEALKAFLQAAPDHDRAPEAKARILMLKRQMEEAPAPPKPDESEKK